MTVIDPHKTFVLCFNHCWLLNPGDVWKFGKTIYNQEGRYGNNLDRRLEYFTEYEGNEFQALVVEKMKI
jgi:hypothetical protein